MIESQEGGITALLNEGGRLQRRDAAVRLHLRGGDLDGLQEAAAWTGAAAVLSAAAGGDGRVEIAVPEAADRVLDAAVNELVRQGLRFLQLDFEGPDRGGPTFVAVFLPAVAEKPAAAAEYLLRHARTGQTWELSPARKFTLGRRADCDVVLQTTAASREHGAVRFTRRAFAVLDLRSTAGSFLDNLPLGRGVVDEFGRICLGRKDTGHYLELELRVPPAATAFLHVVNGPSAGQELPLTRPTVTVGRAPHCDLQIDAPYVSREHLRLTLLTDCFVLVDLASRNGTVLNQRPVLGGRLVAGDQIQVGDEVFDFLTRDALDGYFVPGWRVRAGDRETSLDRPLTTVGRVDACAFALPGAEVSRRHARFVWERPGRLKVYDLASFGGLALDNKLVADAELSGGEELRLGSVSVQVLPLG